MAWWRFWERRDAEAPAATRGHAPTAEPPRPAPGPPAWSLLPALAPTAGPIELTAPVQRIADGLAGASPLDRTLAPLGHGTAGPPGLLHGVLRPRVTGTRRTRSGATSLDHVRPPAPAADDDAALAQIPANVTSSRANAPVATLRWPVPATPPQRPLIEPKVTTDARTVRRGDAPHADIGAPAPPPSDPVAPAAPAPAPARATVVVPPPRPLRAVVATPAAPSPVSAAGAPPATSSPPPARTVSTPVPSMERATPLAEREVAPVARRASAGDQSPPVPAQEPQVVRAASSAPGTTAPVVRPTTMRTHVGTPLTARPPSMVRERATPPAAVVPVAAAAPEPTPAPVLEHLAPTRPEPETAPARRAELPAPLARAVPAARTAGTAPVVTAAPAAPRRALVGARPLGAPHLADDGGDAPAPPRPLALGPDLAGLAGLGIVADTAPAPPPRRSRAGLTTLALPAPPQPAITARRPAPPPAPAAAATPPPGPSRQPQAPEAVPADLGAELAPLLGADVTQVPVHRSAESSDAARHLRAKAFTHRGEVHLPERHGSTHAGEGRTMLAHELTHAVQQRRLGAALPAESSPEGARLEHEARVVAGRVGTSARPSAARPVATAPSAPPLPSAPAPPVPVPVPVPAERIAAGVQAAAVDAGVATPIAPTAGGGFGVRFATPPPARDDGVGPVFLGAQRAEDDAPVATPAAGAPPERPAGGSSAAMGELTSADLERLAGRLYPHWRRQYRDELLSDRERTGTLHDVH